LIPSSAHDKVYGIKWGDRQFNYHPGNFKERLGKTELIVK
jgi:hypothetical protein